MEKLWVLRLKLIIHCGSCETKIEEIKRSLFYYRRIYNEKKSKSINERKERKRICNKIRNQERKLSSLQNKVNEQSVIQQKPSNPLHDKKETEDVNLRAMMAVFYQGVGPRDIGNTLSFLGLPGGSSFPQLFYNGMDKFTKEMNTELQEIIDEGLENEIEATIKYELSEEYTAAEIQTYIKNFREDKGFIPERIKKLPIVASYDMGWNKRSTGRVYDSLSGHAFLIGCRSGCVISFGVCAKKMCEMWSGKTIRH